MTKSYGAASPEMSSSDSDDVDMDHRPKKRARVGSDYTPTQRRIMLEEVDLEIAMHERIAAVLESRMTWALLLQRTLENSQSNVPWTIPGFQDFVVTALEAVEEPCNVLHNQNLRVALAPTPTPPVATTPTPAPPAVPEDITVTSAYSTRRGGTRRGPTAPPRKLLYLLNRTTHPPQTVKLACPDCGKTSFSSLQGLLNHCRLSHSREFGSHDECVQRCAVLVETEEEQAWVIANGSEVAGIGIPGLKRLFELAVGGGQAVVPILPPTQYEVNNSERQPLDSAVLAQEAPAVTPEAAPSDLTRTLGHHIDTPSLAPFLGRESKRRSIRVYDEDVEVDVLGSEATSKPHLWRMHYTHRSKARASLDEIVQTPAEPPAVEEVLPATSSIKEPVAPNPSIPIFHGPGSRFHITARVSIQDLSLWIPPTRRSQAHPDHTHKWRIAVTAPSYSLPLSIFLAKLTITCLTEPPPSTFSHPITITQAPFTVTSTTDRPFLARLSFEWSGPNELNPPTSIEHWVDLDPIHYSAPVLGDEQFFDIELDRHTQFLPASTEQSPPSWTVEGDILAGSAEARNGDKEEEEPDYVVRLRSLLPQFPMTAKDVKGRSGPPQVPYTLVSTPSQLRNLVYGRRKAIEWARAHAIHSAYHHAEPPEDYNPPTVPLTVGDVFHWLEDEGLFSRRANPRPQLEDSPLNITPKMRAEVKSEDAAEAFCRYCGLHSHLHPTALPAFVDSASDPVKQEPIPDLVPSKPSAPLACQTFQASSSLSELPVVDVNRLIPNAASSQLLTRHTGIPTHSAQHPIGDDDIWGHRNLLSATHPQLIRACTRFLAHPTPSVPATNNQETNSLITLHNKPRILLDDELAPAALLALMVKPLVKLLVKAGSDTYRQDETELRGQGRRVRRDIPVRRLLTPMHIVRGLQHEAQHSATASAMLLALSPLGLSLSPTAAVVEDFYPAEDFR